MRQQQRDKIQAGRGFIAALDQSGGSTPKALAQYGVPQTAYRDDAGMFDLIHQMRCRIIKSPLFTSDRVIGAILFQQTMAREIGGIPAAQYLWEQRGVVPFLKIDAGLEAPHNDCQKMRAIPDLKALLNTAHDEGIFGTKARAVISGAHSGGIAEIVAQQFDLGDEVLAHGLVPILEPEVSISIPDKAAAEEILRGALIEALDALSPSQSVMLKLTIPETDNFYAPLVNHPRVLRVVALSGGYTRDAANQRLARNHGIIASFSRALTEGLRANQSDSDFDAALGKAINAIYAASIT